MDIPNVYRIGSFEQELILCPCDCWSLEVGVQRFGISLSDHFATFPEAVPLLQCEGH